MEIGIEHLLKIVKKLIYYSLKLNLIDIVLYRHLGVVELIQSGLGKYWVQLSLANDLLIAIQLDFNKVREEIGSSRNAAWELDILNSMKGRKIYLTPRRNLFGLN